MGNFKKNLSEAEIQQTNTHKCVVAASSDRASFTDFDCFIFLLTTSAVFDTLKASNLFPKQSEKSLSASFAHL